MDSDDQLDIDDYVFYMLGPWYISDLKDDYTDHVEEGYTIELIDMSLAFAPEIFIRFWWINVVGFCSCEHFRPYPWLYCLSIDDLVDVDNDVEIF